MRSFNLNDYYTKKQEELLKGYDEYEYDLIKWKDHIPEFGDTKKEIILKKDKDGHEIVKHERFDGNVFQEGTAVNAENLGYMDYGIFMMHGKLKELYEKMTAMQLQMATMLRQNQNNMAHNMFYANAKNIGTDIVIVEGYYDEVNARGVV